MSEIMNKINQLIEYLDRRQKSLPPVQVNTVRRVLLLNMLAFVVMLAISIVRKDLSLWVIAVIPFGLSMGLYFSIGDLGLASSPPKEAGSDILEK